MGFSFGKYKNLLNSRVGIVLLILVALIVRIYYLFITADQTMWWDEAEYMSTAKSWALGVPYDINPQRPPLFQLLAALFIKVGFGEVALKFLLVVLPSVALVIAVYYLGKELYGKKIGFISAALTSFIWSLLFWSVRFQPDFFSVTLQVISCSFFWKFIKFEKNKYALYTGLFVAAGFYFKISALLVPLSMVVFAIYYEGFGLIKKKNYWLILGSFIMGMIPFMIWQLVMFGNPLAFAPSYSGDFNEGRELGWMVLDFYYSFPQALMFVFFLISLVAFIGKTLLSADLIVKDKSLRKDSSMFSFIVLLIVALFYIFYIKGTIEDRWVFLVIPFILLFSAKTIENLYIYLHKHSKNIAILIISIMFLIFLFYQVNYATAIINNKKESYSPVKESSVLIRQNSEIIDKILSVSYTQTTAYAEREVITYAKLSIENFTKILKEEKPKFIIASILEPHHPDWMVQQVQNEQGYRGILFPYFNSSIIISPQNQVVQFDIKKQTSNDDATFTLIYPYDNNFGGLVAYKIDYKD
ncbi:MAG: glycosyltransferase family 39 protein [Nanoarchaeota archaeon]